MNTFGEVIVHLDDTRSPQERAWEGFQSAHPKDVLHERCDHAAIALYLVAPDPPRTREQDARVQRMRRVAPTRLPPTVESHEQEDPYTGASTLFTLTMGKYGIWKRLNGSDPKIASEPKAQVPPTFDIHLCWFVGYAGRRAIVPNPSECGRPTTAASVFQAVVALVLDDWRDALAGLRVRFRLHPAGREEPLLDRIDPGPRWKRNGELPPDGVIGCLFRRQSLAELATAPSVWEEEREWGADWWLAAVAAEDLPGLGFVEAKRAGQEIPEWRTTTRAALPVPVRTVLVLNAEKRTGWVYDVQRAGDAITLRQPHHRFQAEKVTDGSFAALRRNALNAVLAALASARR